MAQKGGDEDPARAAAANATLRANLGNDGKPFTSAKEAEEAARSEGVDVAEVCPALDPHLAQQDPVHGRVAAEAAADLLLARSMR